MGSLDDDEDSNIGSSENEGDDTMEDMDDGDGTGDNDADGGDLDDNEDNEDDEDPEESQSRPRTEPSSRQNSAANISTQGDYERSPRSNSSSLSHRRSSLNIASAPYQPTVRPETISAPTYDIVPTIAAPHSTSINAITATPDMRWVFSGGADGWVRKFNWPDTVNGKTLLTVAQRHLFVDSVTKAGVLMSYWENEETPYKEDHVPSVDEAVSLSPVYSLAVQRQGLWVLSGTESGVINVQSVRHEEGKRITSLNKHVSAVSCLRISDDEQSLLSGSWDKTIIDWDLNTGKVKRTFTGSVGQISALEMRPHSTVAIPREDPVSITSNTFTTSIGEKTYFNSSLNGVDTNPVKPSFEGMRNSPTDSLFGDGGENDSLFGDNDVGNGALDFSHGLDDDFPDLPNGIRNENGNEESKETYGENSTSTPKNEFQASLPDDFTTSMLPNDDSEQPMDLTDDPLETSMAVGTNEHSVPQTNSTVDEPIGKSSENVFLDAAIDGILRVWDRRQPNPITRMLPPRQTPPWCMHACWSPDGNYIYAGRRNGTVDEYSVHKGLREPIRSLKFPGGSGAVSAVKAMPNSRHLVCASFDILRLYDLQDEEAAKHARVPFLIVPGHRTGVVSHLFVDPTCTYMISTAGNRGWEGTSAEVLLGYEIGIGR